MPSIKTRCPFCPMQDAFYLEETPRAEKADWGKKSVLNLEFDKDSVRGLCGRGNFCQELAVHKERVFRSRIGLQYFPVEKVAEDLSKKLAGLSGERIAILLDGSLTLEETAKAIELAKKLGTKFVSFLPIEDIATAQFNNYFSFEGIANARTNLVIGDVFTQSPTMTRLIHDAKARARQNSFVQVDTVHSRTGWFAHPELIVKLGVEAEFIDALTEAVSGKPIEDIQLDKFGVSAGDFEWAVGSIRAGAENGCVIVCPGWHFSDPFAVCKSAQNLAKTAKMAIAFIPISTGTRGIYRLLSDAGMDILGTIRAFRNEKIDALIALDCDPSASLPGVKLPEILAMTGQMKTDGYNKASHFFATNFLFEKRGSLLGTEGNFIEITEKLDSPGVPSVSGIIDLLYGGSIVIPGDIQARIRDFKEPENPPFEVKVQSGEIFAVGNPHVNHHSDGRLTRKSDYVVLRNAVEVSQVIIPQKIAKKINIETNDKVRISNGSYSSEFPAKVVDWLGENIVLVPMHYPPARELFNIVEDFTGSPVVIKVERV